MKKCSLMRYAIAVLCIGALAVSQATAAVISSTDPIIAIDLDPPSSVSSYPAAENPPKAFDALSATKYLNFAGNVPRNTGAIITPTGGATTLRSLRLTTANDAPERDPSNWVLFGTNSAIVSADNSDGQGEAWNMISAGAALLPDTRGTLGPVYTFANATAYTSYRVVFPEVKNFLTANSMQVADIGLFTSTDGTGTSLTAVDAAIRAIQLPVSRSKTPVGQDASKILDADATTKLLSFSKENSGVIVTRAAGAKAVGALRFTSGGDAPERDPLTWTLFGTNSPITSAPFSQGTSENWTQLGTGTTGLPTTRLTAGPFVQVGNAVAFTSYRLVFPTLRDTVAANSMQIGGVEFLAPEPGSMAMALVGLMASCGLRRRKS